MGTQFVLVEHSILIEIGGETADDGCIWGDVMKRRAKPLDVIAILAGLVCALVTTFIGVFAVPFMGYGYGLANIANHYLNITLGIELPLYVALIAISRRALVYVCWAMCVLSYIGAILLALCDISGAVSVTVLLRVLGESMLFPGEISSIAAALAALYLYKRQDVIRKESVYRTGGDGGHGLDDAPKLH